MLFALCTSALLHTLFFVALLSLLTPFRCARRTVLTTLTLASVLLSLFVLSFLLRGGMDILSSFGMLILGLPLIITFGFLSSAKGIHFVFIALTALIFQQLVGLLLQSLYTWDGGFTPLYFLLSCLAFALLLLGAYAFRKTYHKLLFSHRVEFLCLVAVLLMLFFLSWLFSPFPEGSALDGDLFVITLLIDLLIFLFYLYLGVNFHSLSRHGGAARDALSLRLQMEEAQNHIALLRSAQEKTALYRHDLRHHLSLIRSFLDSRELDELRAYLDEVQTDAEQQAPELHCQNEAANLLLASFSSRARAVGVQLLIDAQIPPALPLSNPELCTLLSNALENAITATQEVNTDRSVRLMVRFSDGKLLILVENPCKGEVRIENGLPRSSRSGHGIGVQSIASIVEKHGGLSSFEAKDGLFTLRIAI